MATESDALQTCVDELSETQARPKVAAREAIAEVFEELGGVGAMVEWVKANPDHEKVFYTSIYPKLIPVQLGEKEEPVVTELAVRFY